MSLYANLLETEQSRQDFSHLLDLTRQRKWTEFRRFCRQLRKDYDWTYVLRLHLCLFEEEELDHDLKAVSWLCDATTPRKTKYHQRQKQALLDRLCDKSA